MKNIFSVMLATVAVIGLFSCEEESPVYEPAQQESGAQVYFSQDVVAVTSYNIRGVESLPIQVNRANTASDVTVAINATCENAAVKLPTEVHFAAGESTTSYVITFDQSGIVENTNYGVSLKIGNDTTLYGVSQYDFTVAAQLPWNKFAKGHFTEEWWGEEEDETLYYQQISDTERYCYISNCFDTEGSAVPTNFYFYWNTETNKIRVPHQYMGYTSSSYGQVFVGDVASGYIDYFGYSDYTPEWFWENGYPQSYYDGNGGFYFYNCYYVSAGWYTRDNLDVFIAEGFVRKDFTATVAYAGTYTDASGNLGVLAVVTPAADVESMKVGVCAEGAEETCLAGIIDGSWVSVEATAEGTVQVPFVEKPIDGKYTIVAVTYGDDEVQETATATFKYEAPSSDEETWTLVGTGDYTYTLCFTNDDGTPYVDAGLELYQCDQDKTQYKITHWGYDVDFKFTMLSTGAVYVPEQETGCNSSYGMISVVENVDYVGSTKYGTSSYDAESDTFTFCVSYIVSAGYFGIANYNDAAPETFVLKGEEEAAAAPARRAQNFVQAPAKKTGMFKSYFLMEE